jgi:hypothetical protein
MKLCWTLPVLVALLLPGLFAVTTVRAELSPKAILEECDKARGNLEGVIWTVSVEAREKGKQHYRKLLVKSRGFDTVAEILAPPQQKGHLLLMVKGNMWFYKPDISKPVPVSQRQKLLGLATNGDIASTNYARDYEILDWQETLLDGEPCYQFELAAKGQAATYARIRYWVAKQPLVGIKAEFYTANGDKLLKSALMRYENLVATQNGRQPFISKMMIHDELLSDDVTTLNFSDPALQPIPDHVFNLNLLRK